MPPEAHQRKRARQACTHCNARRVKCNVTEAVPCDNCVAAGTECELRESRRGKHPRVRLGQNAKRASISAATPADGLKHRPPSLGISPTDIPTVAGSSPSLAGDGTGTNNAFAPNDELGQASLALASLSRDAHRDDDEGSVFLGESTSIRYVGNEGPGAPTAQFHSLPTDGNQSMLRWEAERKDATINALRSRPDGAFSLPPRHITIQLLKAYFEWFHPCQPVVDERDTWHQYETGSMSTLLLQSMLFVAAAHCSDDVLKEGMLGDRHEAKFKFYTRARDLYDADVENNNLTVIQALFLISFWRGHVPQEKDVRHWLGAALSLAQRRGLHRSRKKPSPSAANAVSERISKLRKRLWWSIYVRERQCSAALGLPNRIRDEDCDIEALDASDFEYAFNPSLPESQVFDFIQYATGIAYLAKVLGEVVHRVYLPNKPCSSADRIQLRDELAAWKQSLPSSMQVADDLGLPPTLHSSMLHLAYNNIFILLYRNCYVSNTGGADGEVALQAAARNSRIIEDMLPRNTLRHAQIHVITNLFNTLCMHTIDLRRAKGNAKTIAEHRAKVCLLGLQELQQTWEVRNWVLQLFFRYLDRPTAARLQSDTEDGSSAYTRSPAPLAVDYGDFTRDEAPRVHMTLAPDVDTIWAWPNEETDRFLFSQIYNSFPFGETAWNLGVE